MTVSLFKGSMDEFIKRYKLWVTLPLWRDLVKISTRKLWHTSSFSSECTDFKTVTLKKFTEPLLRSPRLLRISKGAQWFFSKNTIRYTIAGKHWWHAIDIMGLVYDLGLCTLCTCTFIDLASWIILNDFGWNLWSW